MRRPAGAPEPWLPINHDVLKFSLCRFHPLLPFPGLAGWFQMQASLAATKASPRPQLRVPMCRATHSLGASNFPALGKPVLLSTLSQRKCISVSSVKRKVSMKEESWCPRSVRVCVYEQSPGRAIRSLVLES